MCSRSHHPCALNPDHAALDPSALSPALIRRAALALQRAFERNPELSSRQTTSAIASVLPPQLRARFLARLHESCPADPPRPLPFDALDGAQAKSSFPGGWLTLARLAAFGMPGQGQSFNQKHRDALYQRCASEIQREALDLPRLQRVAHRVLGNREVAPDSILVGMLRTLINQKESELRAAAALQQHPTTETSATASLSTAQHGTGFFTREQVRGMLTRLVQKFEDHVSHYEELAARECMHGIEELGRKYPVHIEAALIDRYRQAHSDFAARCAQWRKAIDGLASRGEHAADDGDERTAAWVIRRLHAIHALRPGLLDEYRLNELCKQIQAAEDTVEEREAAEELISREKEIAAEIRSLAQAVRRFHNIARHHAPESEEFRAAADAYRAAVQQVNSHDQAWLTSVFMELEDIGSELHRDSQAETQINSFIDELRSALIRIREEIRAIHAERLDQK